MTIKLIYNRRKSTGKAAIDLHVFVKRNDFTFISTGVVIEPEFFDARSNMVKAKHPKAIAYNAHIRAMMRKVEDYELTCIRQGINFTAADVRFHLKASVAESRNLNQYMHEQLELDSVQLSAGRVKQCRSILRNFDRFGIYSFHQFDSNAVRKFHNHLRITMQETSTQKNHKLVKKYLSRAFKNKLTENNPYDDFKIPAAREKRTYLTPDELEMLRQFNGHPRLEKVRDLFLFMCLTGISFSDMAKLSAEMVVNENSDTFIMFSRTKTDVRQMVFLLPEAHRIIEKYKGDRKIFSSISNQKMNNYLKELGALCNISKELTSHVGRHTFATNMLSLGMPLESIQAMLGHANIKTTSIYTNLISSKLSNDFKRLGIDGL